MADIKRVNGTATGGGFYGYQYTVIRVQNNNVFTADTVAADLTITEGGYTKAIKAAEMIGSIVILGDRDSGADYFTAVFDRATLNDGAGATTAGTWGALKDALASEVGGSAGDYTVVSSTALNGDASFTLA